MKDIVRVGKIEQLTTDGFVTDSISVISGNLFTLENIRSAGIRCETCEHFNMVGDCETYDGKQGYEDNGHGWDVPVKSYKPDFFCAHHSALQNEEG